MITQGNNNNQVQVPINGPAQCIIPVLFTRKNSIYLKLPFTDVYDINRDALSYSGSSPVIAHPPCRGWSRLRRFSNHTEDEKNLARWTVKLIQVTGGVLEHPECSSLWKDMNLPFGNSLDQYGGWTLSIDQKWFGHRARKRTWLYIVGISPRQIPSYPLSFDATTHVVARGRRYTGKKELSKAARESTPIGFAKWLLLVARSISDNKA